MATREKYTSFYPIISWRHIQMKLLIENKWSRFLVLSFFCVAANSSAPLSAAYSGDAAVRGFCSHLEILFYNNDNTSLIQHIDNLINDVRGALPSFIRQMGNQRLVNQLISDLEDIKKKARSGSISATQIGMILKKYVQYLPADMQAKVSGVGNLWKIKGNLERRLRSLRSRVR